MSRTQLLVSLFAALMIGAGLYFAFRERPVAVDMASVVAGPMKVSIQEEGVARVRDIYTVSSPIAGHLDRTTLEIGDSVSANETVIASIHPLDPPFIDERQRAEMLAAVEAANSGVALARVEHSRATLALELARSEYDRASRLAKTGIIPDSQLERTYNEMKLKEAEVASTEAAIRLREAELASANARLRQPSDINTQAARGEGCCVHVFAPIDGVVLKVMAESEQAVSPGAPIAEIGEPGNIEIAVDLLSKDAPRIEIGGTAMLTEWGGDEALKATVRRIDPAAFTKVSALGIEEQRVNVILDPERVPQGLGHGFEVLAELEVWASEDAIQVPIGALFRSDGSWAVFTVENEVAHLRKIEIGKMNNSTAQVLAGLSENDVVVLYPSDQIEDGSLISER
jgi:HlyD family secretion protein